MFTGDSPCLIMLLVTAWTLQYSLLTAHASTLTGDSQCSLVKHAFQFSLVITSASVFTGDYPYLIVFTGDNSCLIIFSGDNICFTMFTDDIPYLSIH